MSGYEFANIYVEYIVDEPIDITEDELKEFVEPIKNQ